LAASVKYYASYGNKREKKCRPGGVKNLKNSRRC
jgi:hypothetical protein